MENGKIYFCIDMKCFFASVECSERGLNPFTTNLIVADAERGDGTICLAVSPRMKELGVKNRCRLFQVPKHIEYIIAKPRMKKYIEYAADIYEIYLRYISSDDIHVYSIDEAFLDVTDYLKIYKKNPKEFAKFLMRKIEAETGIPSTVGIGTNMYLAKIALDITAKKTTDRMAFLDEEEYKNTLWNHRPITDFWQIATGTAKRLSHYGVFDMKGITEMPEKILYKEFGINAELLIDHAYGIEPCTIADIKAYKGKSRSVSSSQILFKDYGFEDAKIVLLEMVLNGCYNLIKHKLVTKSVTIYVGYSKNAIPATSGTAKMVEKTNLYSIIKKYVTKIFDDTTVKNFPIRKLGYCFNNLVSEIEEEYDLFTDWDTVRKEKDLSNTVINLKQKFGKNTLLRAIDLTENATAIMRNNQVGGHNGE